VADGVDADVAPSASVMRKMPSQWSVCAFSPLAVYIAIEIRFTDCFEKRAPEQEHPWNSAGCVSLVVMPLTVPRQNERWRAS